MIFSRGVVVMQLSLYYHQYGFVSEICAEISIKLLCPLLIPAYNGAVNLWVSFFSLTVSKVYFSVSKQCTYE